MDIRTDGRTEAATICPHDVKFTLRHDGLNTRCPLYILFETELLKFLMPLINEIAKSWFGFHCNKYETYNECNIWSGQSQLVCYLNTENIQCHTLEKKASYQLRRKTLLSNVVSVSYQRFHNRSILIK